MSASVYCLSIFQCRPLYAGGNVAAGVADVGNPVKIGGKYNASQPTLTDGQRGDANLNANGNLFANPIFSNNAAAAGATNADALATNSTAAAQITNAVGRLFNASTYDRSRNANSAAAVANGIGSLSVEEGGRTFSHITAAAPTATVVKSGAGHFGKLCINTPAATGVITVYDNTAASGTVIAVITQPAVLLSTQPVCLPYDVAFGTGLTVNTATAAQDLTVTYR